MKLVAPAIFASPRIPIIGLTPADKVTNLVTI
jgi:hypothetical protein